MRISDWSSDVCSSDLSTDVRPQISRVHLRGRAECDARTKASPFVRTPDRRRGGLSPGAGSATLETHARGQAVTASEDVVGGRIGVPRIERRRPDIIADERRVLVEQILDRQREREAVGDLGAIGTVEIAVTWDREILKGET